MYHGPPAATADTNPARDLIESRVAERCQRETPEQVRDTCSFARAERLLADEYHGRFLIELLQNAADAWRAVAEPGSRSRVRIVIAEGPALIVANEGGVFPADIVLDSLGQIGASTKPEGEAIGHKGIGFKSVLEVSLAPQLYSGLSAPEPELSVRFDPRRALEVIRARSPHFDEYLDEVEDMRDDPLSAVPVLRYPTWTESVPSHVRELAADGFDTVVVLPFDDELRPDRHLDEEAWLRKVRDALGDVTDEMLLLLGTFEEVTIEDRLLGSEPLTVRPERHKGQEPVELGNGATREQVDVTRNGKESTSWLLFRRTLPDGHSLAGELAVGLRVERDGVGRRSLVAAGAGQSGAPFHLFFPTKIGSGLPFLLHGYFKVNAARTGFYDGAKEHNGAILEALAELVGTAVQDTTGDNRELLAPLADLLGECTLPEDDLASDFRDTALSYLDEVAWVPVERDEGTPGLGKPTALLVAKQTHVIDRVRDTFPTEYVAAKTGLGIPARSIGGAGHEFLVGRLPAAAPGVWGALSELCRPGPGGPWAPGKEDDGFVALTELVAALDVEDSDQTAELLDSLRGDPDSCLLPAMAQGGGRELVAVPGPPEKGAAARRTVMARTAIRGGGAQEDLIPPPSMRVAFLRDGLLTSETEVDRAKPLGVRDFTVNNVLDRMADVESGTGDPDAVLGFVWALLARESASEYGVRTSLRRLNAFDPATSFWCRPGDWQTSENEAGQQRRRRLLSTVPLPARNGTWRPAGDLAFGADWAEWIAGGACGELDDPKRTRVRAYRALEAVSPGDADMLGAPQEVLAALPPVAGAGDEDPDGELRRNAERLAFLLSLGVWEVLPVDAFADAGRQDRDQFPWPGPYHDQLLEIVKQSGGWRFRGDPWPGGDTHKNVWVAEDFRLRWPLTPAANKAPSELADLLSLGTGLYSRLLALSAFCTGCINDGSRHQRRITSSPQDGFPSTLALQLRTDGWIPATLNGAPLDQVQAASAVWWTDNPPTGSGLVRSPLRFLPLVRGDVEISGALRDLAGVCDLDGASLETVGRLLSDLAADFRDGTLPVPATGGARQPFVSLHGRAYRRLHELSAEDPDGVSDLLERVGVLCEFGETLVYRPPTSARHDDGTFAAYRRHFAGRIAFAAVRPEQTPIAKSLGIPPFQVLLERRNTTEELDVTDELSELLSDRLPAFLSIVVHHSLGTQTLDPGNPEFEERARRLANLRVLQVPDLVIDATVNDTDVTVTIGEGSDQDLFLEQPTSAHPRLYHDLSGPTWTEDLRRKLAPHVARLLGSPAHSSTIALFLLAGTESEQEDVLHELGISAEDVENIGRHIGAVSEDDRRRQRRWFTAVLGALGAGTKSGELQLDEVPELLTSAGLDEATAANLVDLGGGEDVRRDDAPDGALGLLQRAGVDLADLDARLVSDGDDGLDIRRGRQLLWAWVAQHKRRAAVVLSRVPGRLPEEAKAEADSWKPPDQLRLELDPAPQDWLEPVVISLGQVGVPDADALATDPVGELVRLSDLNGQAELDQAVAAFYDPEEQRRILRASAAAWRSELELLGVLVRTGPGDTRGTIRSVAAAVQLHLPVNPESPAELRPALGDLLGQHPDLVGALAEHMSDSLIERPERGHILQLAADHGVATGHADLIVRALEAPARDRARKLKSQIAVLEDIELRPAVPPSLLRSVEAPGPSGKGKKKVPKIKVDPGHDQRKRRLGDEGEQWALAAIVGDLARLSDAERRGAVDAVLELLDEYFESSGPVEAARAHAEPACEIGLDDEDLIDELSGLLHVSAHSDAFGFDLLGWIRPSDDAEPRALCLEVKSTADGSFHLSPNEWQQATLLKDRYAILAVRRSPKGGAPARMDLLVDPVELVKDGLLSSAPDGFKIKYKTPK